MRGLGARARFVLAIVVIAAFAALGAGQSSSLVSVGDEATEAGEEAPSCPAEADTEPDEEEDSESELDDDVAPSGKAGRAREPEPSGSEVGSPLSALPFVFLDVPSPIPI